MTLLTDKDLIKLTGYKMPRSQREIMLKWGLPFRARTDGTVMTTWKAINNALKRPQHRGANLQALRNRR